MSGHSHAKNVKRIKEADAKRRGQIFSKISRLITVAVREGGANIETNSKLRMAVEMAREFNMPKENVERAIKRASGETDREKLEEISFEAYGPGGVALIIEGITDNKRRTISELKQILQEYQGKLVKEGTVKWMFKKMGCIRINLKDQDKKIEREEMELIAIEAGAEDLFWKEDGLEVYTKVEELEEVKRRLKEKGIKIETTSLDWIPKERIKLDEKRRENCERLFESLDENDAVQEIYSNLEI